MAPKKRKHGKIITKKIGPKSCKSQSPDKETPPPDVRQNNTAIEEISLTRLKSLKLKNDPVFKSLITLFEDREKNSEYVLTDAELDRTQWLLESTLSSTIFRKKTIQNDLASLKAIQSTSSQHQFSNNPYPTAIRPRAVPNVPLIKEVHQIKSTEKPLRNQEKTESNKFWSLVKPYLEHVTKEDLDWLKELVLSYDSSENVFDIPPLGEHYSKNWTQKDLKKQNNQPSCSQSATQEKRTIQVMPNIVELVNKINHIADKNDSFRPIYQKVVSDLLEHHSNISLDKNDKDRLNKMNITSKKFFEEKNMINKFHTLGLNQNSKPVLPATGSPSSYAKSDTHNDEIADELHKCNTALAELQKVNKNHLTNLLKTCCKDYSQQITHKKIRKVENEILNFKRQPNILLSNDEKIAQYSKENNEMKLLTSKRNRYLTRLQSKTFEPDKCFENFFSDESESSDEETNKFQEHFKMPPSKNAIDVHQILDTDDELEY